MAEPTAGAEGRIQPSDQRQSRQRLLIAVLFLLSVLVPAAVAYITIKLHQRHELNLSMAASRKLALVLLANFERTTESIESFLDGFYDLSQPQSPEEVYARLKDAKLPASIIQVSFVDPRGRMVASNLAPPGNLPDLSDREHIRAHLNTDTDADYGLFLSKPVKGRISGAWSMQFTKAIRKENGELAGIIAASFQISNFIDFYNELRPDGRGLVALIGFDGVVRASVSDTKPDDARALEVFADFEALSGKNMGAYAGDAPDGVERIGYFVRSTRFPILVLVAADYWGILGQSADFQLAIAVTAVVLSLTLMAVASLTLRRFRLERAYREKAMQATARQRESQVLQAISQVPGVSVLHMESGHVTPVGTPTAGPLARLIEERASSPDFLRRLHAAGTPFSSVEHFSRDGEEFEVQFVVTDLHTAQAAADAPAQGGSDRPAVVFAVDETAKRMEENKLYQMSKMASLGELVTGLAHEINQPLGVIRLAAKNALNGVRNGLPSTHMEEKLDRIVRQVERMKVIIDHMRIFGRRSSLAPEPCSVRAAMEGLVQILGAELRVDAIDLTLAAPDDDLQVLCRQEQLEQVLINLVINARDAIRSRRDREPYFQGSIAISTGLRDETGSSFACITVKDNGGGIPEAAIGKIFQPFFTTKPAGKGTGLGLSVSFGIIRDHGGSLAVENEEDGAAFTILLPLTGAVAEGRSTDLPTAAAS
ncbi:ATP-binding protein [Ancylobacter sp. WKF20]|uniref:ATP-binding protein n=1 Tax=Ancylobacter sp. WKF20 TaxID=3039801 RepID=UPI0024344DA3|nr:ATP-binding protein [Ancylobacter sp. WKF20]WGD28611.1 ATP-binding protein [Ancylobacter sp. WKF20]